MNQSRRFRRLHCIVLYAFFNLHRSFTLSPPAPPFLPHFSPDLGIHPDKLPIHESIAKSVDRSKLVGAQRSLRFLPSSQKVPIFLKKKFCGFCGKDGFRSLRLATPMDSDLFSNGSFRGHSVHVTEIDGDATTPAFLSPLHPSSLPSSPSSIRHRVSKMDTLAGVAIKYGVEVINYGFLVEKERCSTCILFLYIFLITIKHCTK